MTIPYIPSAARRRTIAFSRQEMPCRMESHCYGRFHLSDQSGIGHPVTLEIAGDQSSFHHLSRSVAVMNRLSLSDYQRGKSAGRGVGAIGRMRHSTGASYLERFSITFSITAIVLCPTKQSCHKRHPIVIAFKSHFGQYSPRREIGQSASEKRS
jgi:hypothetical protein